MIIRHPNGQSTQYAHLNRSFYEPGNWVPQGRIIGWVGATGAADGAHLHYSVIDCNTRVSLPSTIEGYVRHGHLGSHLPHRGLTQDDGVRGPDGAPRRRGRPGRRAASNALR